MKKYLLLILMVFILVAGYFYYSNFQKESAFYKDLLQQADIFCENIKISSHGIDKASCKSIDFVRTNPNLTEQGYCERVDLAPESGSVKSEKDNIILCKNEIAASIGNISMCVSGDSPFHVASYESCVDRIIMNSKDPNACKIYLPDVQKENECYSIVARELSDIKVCDKSVDPIYNSQCRFDYYQDKGFDNVDSSVCSIMKNDYLRSRCYVEVAAKKRNQDLCKEVGPSYAREYGSWEDDGLPLNLAEYCLIVSDPKFGVQ